jgi:hypothetical protein
MPLVMEHRTSERGELSLTGWAGVFIVVAILVWVPYSLLTRHRPPPVDQNLLAIDKTKDTSAEVTLTDAVEVAQTWYASNGTLLGFTPAAAIAQEPDTRWNASTTATSGVISIRGADATSVVLVTKGAGPLCIAVNSTGAVTYGHVNATSAAECTGAAW